MPDPTTENTYPGERLGRPATGPGSVARFGRRTVALIIDYAAASLIATAFFGYDQFTLPEQAGLSMFSPLMVFAILHVLFIPTVGGSPGHRIVGLRLELLHGGWPGLWRPIVRTLLLVVVVPALIWDADQRGLHDKAAGTILVRA